MMMKRLALAAVFGASILAGLSALGSQERSPAPAPASQAKAASPFSDDKTPVERYGRLRVENRQLVSEQGVPVQLRGFSTHDIAGFDWLLAPEYLDQLIHVFHADVVRLAMYTERTGTGYIANPGTFKILEQILDDAEKAGIYCIVDWHILRDRDPNQYKAEAIDYFGKIAEKYKDKKHLLFEICNEPNGAEVTWNEKIRPYAVDVLAAIRKADPTRVVLVGTPTWSQDVDIAAQNPIPDPNVMYVFHWYAGTHGKSLRDKVDEARKTIPLFNTEWGSTDSSGGGDPYPAQTATWLKFLDDRGISSCNWSFSNAREGSAALLPSYDMEGTLKESLSPSGEILFRYLTAAR